jgi:hypothetical protein
MVSAAERNVLPFECAKSAIIARVSEGRPKPQHSRIGIMSPLEPWADAWLNGKTMPPHTLSHEWIDLILIRAEDWMVKPLGPRKQLEEFVSGDRTSAIMDGLLYSGFCRDRTKAQRIRPIPVLVRMLYTTPAPVDPSDVQSAMIRTFAEVLSEWCQLHLSGQKYDIVP